MQTERGREGRAVERGGTEMGGVKEKELRKSVRYTRIRERKRRNSHGGTSEEASWSANLVVETKAHSSPRIVLTAHTVPQQLVRMTHPEMSVMPLQLTVAAVVRHAKNPQPASSNQNDGPKAPSASFACLFFSFYQLIVFLQDDHNCPPPPQVGGV